MSSAPIVVNNPCDLETVCAEISGQVFDLDRLKWDSRECKVTIPYERAAFQETVPIRKRIWSREYADVRRCFLEIDGVIELAAQDDAGVGRFWFDCITFDEAGQCILIDASPSLQIRLKVTRVSVRSTPTELVLGIRTRRYLLGTQHDASSIVPKCGRAIDETDL